MERNVPIGNGARCAPFANGVDPTLMGKRHGVPFLGLKTWRFESKMEELDAR